MSERRGGRTGQAVIEFSLCFLLFISIILTTFSFCFWVFAKANSAAGSSRGCPVSRSQVGL